MMCRCMTEHQFSSLSARRKLPIHLTKQLSNIHPKHPTKKYKKTPHPNPNPNTNTHTHTPIAEAEQLSSTK